MTRRRAVLIAGAVVTLVTLTGALLLPGRQAEVRGAVLSLVPYGALVEYGPRDGVSTCAHAVGVQGSSPSGSGPGMSWQEAVLEANAAARALSGNALTTGLVGARGEQGGVLVQSGPGRAELPVQPGEVVLLRQGKLSVELLPQEITTGKEVAVPVQAEWFPGPLLGGSAGLALGISAMDAFTSGPLCKGAGPVAASGILNSDGTVEPVQSIGEKAVLADRAGMRAFFVPQGQGAQARELLDEGSVLAILEVGSLSDAVQILSKGYSE